MRYTIALILAFALVASTKASAGEVYKCTLGGASAFQDKPCVNGKKLDVAGSVAGPAQGAGHGTGAPGLKDLGVRIQQTTANQRRLYDDMNREVMAVRARYSPTQKQEISTEIARIQAEYQPRMERERATETALIEEIRKRCPKGAMLNDASQSVVDHLIVSQMDFSLK